MRCKSVSGEGGERKEEEKAEVHVEPEPSRLESVSTDSTHSQYQ